MSESNPIDLDWFILLVNMRIILFICFSWMLAVVPLIGQAAAFEKQARYTVCFTPGQNCTANIVNAIDNAISNIWVQAYSFTARPIAQALVMAQQRGVNVQVILDKSALEGKKTTLDYFVRHHIPVWIDNQPAIAHNKVMIIDQIQVITGSFNFTYAAQQKNAENLLIIEDAGLAKKYLINWENRARVSQSYKARVYSTTAEQDEGLMALWRWLLRLFEYL